MKLKHFLSRAGGPLAITITLAASTAVFGQTETVLYRFQGGSDGDAPIGALIADGAGNLYGATSVGGTGNCTSASATGCGTLFQLTPPAFQGGAWTETVLYSFQGGSDGSYPAGGLLMDQAGNLYGMTTYGGAAVADCPSTGCGTVFQLTPPSAPGGAWSESRIYTFQGGTDGFLPTGSLIVDTAGNLYGVTSAGGPARCRACGTVFELTPTGRGAWQKSVLYTFRPFPPVGPIGDAEGPLGVVFDGSGNLIGAAGSGGFCQQFEGGSCFGAVFKLTAPSQPGASWNETIVHRFSPLEQNPVSAPVVDSSGAIYGTVYLGVYRLVGGIVTILHNFSDTQGDGNLPYGGVILDQSGNVYGTTIGGGNQGHGTVYELKRPAGHWQPWTETILYYFGGSPDGDGPDAPLLLGSGGVLYGTTLRGGTTGCVYYSSVGCGAVFQVVP